MISTSQNNNRVEYFMTKSRILFIGMIEIKTKAF